MAIAVAPRTGWDDLGKLILRLTVAGLMLFHGVAKVKGGVGFVEGLLAQNGLPGVLAYGVYVLEIVAPILLILGLMTRLAALAIIFDMLAAIFLVLRPRMFSINQMGGGWAIELEMFFLLASLAIFFLGSGRYALGHSRWD
jgi:putative oxidoreductase